MNKKAFILLFQLLFCCAVLSAQEEQKSDLHKRAEAVDPKQHIASARSLYIHAFNDYANKGKTRLGVQCATAATALYYKENYYKEAFDLLRRADQVIMGDASKSANEKAALYYLVSKERMQMYMKLRKGEGVRDQLSIMDSQASLSNDENLQNDVLYNKAIYYYTFGLNAQGNAVFKAMADKLTAAKDYDKVDEVYRTLIANGRKSGSANLVAQSYSSYMAWKDSVSARKSADSINALRQQIADNEAAITEKDSTLSTRQAVIIGLAILAAILAAVLVLGGLVLMRFIMVTRRQKKTINHLNESNALKAKFISNISAQLEPTLNKLDSRVPEVRALQDFSAHIQTLSELENAEPAELEPKDMSVPPFCESLVDEIRGKVKAGVNLSVKAPNMRASIRKDYVTHILRHLLNNAAIYTPQGGTIALEFVKRGPHAFQFMVSDTGEGIPEEKREDVFKPFLEIRDLTQGDGLGLPICKQMALKMNGDLDIDPKYTKGTRFVLELHT